MHLAIYSAFLLGIGNASVHFVKKSVAVKIYVFASAVFFNRSIPIISNGYVAYRREVQVFNNYIFRENIFEEKKGLGKKLVILP